MKNTIILFKKKKEKNLPFFLESVKSRRMGQINFFLSYHLIHFENNYEVCFLFFLNYIFLFKQLIEKSN